MRLIYTDPGLYSNLGHHANSCRAIRDGFLARNIGVHTLGHRMIVADLQDEFGAHAHFRTYTYWNTDGDPISGWLNAFHTHARTVEEDLTGISGLTRDDVLYFNTARVGQFLGLMNWARKAGENRPTVVVEFGDDPGLTLKDDGSFEQTRDAKGILWRHVKSHIPEEGLSRFHMVTFDPGISKLYSAILGQKVDVLPLPWGRGANPVDRTGKRPITIGILGHQRGEKGYHLVPLICSILMHVLPDVKLLVHNAAPDQMPDIQAQMRAIAKDEPRLELDERIAGAEIWQELLDRSDLLLCPYDPVRYKLIYSAVAAEGLANAIPLVVPNHTQLSQVMAEHGEAGTSFDEWDPKAIAVATGRALDNYDLLATRAFRAAATFNSNQGGGKTAQGIIDLVGASA